MYSKKFPLSKLKEYFEGDSVKEWIHITFISRITIMNFWDWCSKQVSGNKKEE